MWQNPMDSMPKSLEISYVYEETEIYEENVKIRSKG